MKNSIKLLLVAVVAVGFLFVTQNSVFANERAGKYVSLKDQNGSYFKSYSESQSKNKVVLKENSSKPFNPLSVDNRPPQKRKVYAIASSQNNDFIQIYLLKLKRILRAFQY